MKRMKIPGWGQCALVRGGHGDVPAHSSPSRARWLGMRLLVLTMLTIFGSSGAWAQTSLPTTKVTKLVTGDCTKGVYTDVQDNGWFKINGSSYNPVFCYGPNGRGYSFPFGSGDAPYNGFIVMKAPGAGYVEVETDVETLSSASLANGEVTFGQDLGYTAVTFSNVGALRDGDKLTVTMNSVASDYATLLPKYEIGGQGTGDFDGYDYTDNTVAKEATTKEFTLTQNMLKNIFSKQINNQSTIYLYGQNVTIKSVKVSGNRSGKEKKIFMYFQQEGTSDITSDEQDVSSTTTIYKDCPTSSITRYVYIGGSNGVRITSVRWVPAATSVSVESGIAGFTTNAMPTVLPSGALKIKATPNLAMAANAKLKLYKDGNGEAVATIEKSDVTVKVEGNESYLVVNKTISGLEKGARYTVKVEEGNLYCSESVDASRVTVAAGTQLGEFTTATDPIATGQAALIPLTGDKIWSFENTAGHSAFDFPITDAGQNRTIFGSNDDNTALLNNTNELLLRHKKGIYTRYTLKESIISWSGANTDTGLEFIVPNQGVIKAKLGAHVVNTSTYGPNEDNIKFRYYDATQNRYVDLKTSIYNDNGTIYASTTYPVNRQARIHFYCSSGGYSIQQLEYHPDPHELYAYDEGHTWLGNTYADGTYNGKADGDGWHLRIIADANHTITCGRGAFTFDQHSSIDYGWLMFYAQKKGTVRVTFSADDANGKEVSVAPGYYVKPEWAPMTSLTQENGKYVKELKLFNNADGRYVYIGGDAGVRVEKIEWIPGEVNIDPNDLVTVTERTIWEKDNRFGGFQYPSNVATAITQPLLNDGKGDVKPHTLLIYGQESSLTDDEGNTLYEEDGNPQINWDYQTNFTATGALSLVRSSTPTTVNGNGTYDHMVVFRVNGPGVVRVRVAGNGPSGRGLIISTVKGKKETMMESSIKKDDFNGNPGEVDNRGYFDRHQHSSYHEFWGQYTGTSEQEIVIGSDRGVQLQAIEWIPNGTLPTFNPSGCLQITEAGAVINPSNGGNDITLHTTYNNGGRDVTVDNAKPIWTSSQDGRNAPYTGIISSIHNTTNNGYESLTSLAANGEKTIHATTTKGGIVYAVVGTFEGNHNDVCRIEVAGPAAGIELNRYKVKIAKGSSFVLSATPWLECADIDGYDENGNMVEGKMTRIAVSQPNIQWYAISKEAYEAGYTYNADNFSDWPSSLTIPQGANYQPIATLSDNSNVQSYATGELANGATATLPQPETVQINAQNEGIFYLLAKTESGKWAACEIEVNDPTRIYLERIRPSELGAVSTTESLKFKAWGWGIDGVVPNANGEPTKNGEVVTMPNLPIYLTDESAHATMEISGNHVHWQYENGEWYIVYDVVATIKDDFPYLGVEHMNYDTEHTVRFANPDDSSNDTDHLGGTKSSTTLNVNNRAKGQQTQNYCECEYNYRFRTVPDLAHRKIETFLYNVSQRGHKAVSDDIAAGKLLSENTVDVANTSTKSWYCNHRSNIFINGFKATPTKASNNVIDQIVSGEKDANGVAASIIIIPDNFASTGIEKAIQSIEINCEYPGNESTSILFKEVSTDVEENGYDNYTTIAWNDGEPSKLTGHNGYSAIWTPSSPVHYAKIELLNEDVKINQIKIYYYSEQLDEGVASLTFKDRTEDDWLNKINGGLDIGSGDNRFKIAFKQVDKRHFTLRREYERYMSDNIAAGQYAGESTGTVSDKNKNVMVIHDDKVDPCEMYIFSNGNTNRNVAEISSVEFIYEVDDEGKNNLGFRNLYCTSDPRYHVEPGYHIVGYPFEDKDLAVGDYTEGDATGLRKLVYRPESPASFVGISLDANQEGFIFVRKIIVRYDNTARSVSVDGSTIDTKYQFWNADNGSSQKTGTGLATISRDTKGIKIKVPSSTSLPYDHTPVAYTIKRTSTQNNISQEIVLNQSGSGSDIVLNSKAGTSKYLHQKFYTVRVLNQDRMVIRQMGFHTKSNDAPTICYKRNGVWEKNVEMAAADPITTTAPEFKIEVNKDDGHTPEQTLVIWTTNGEVPEVKFAPNGRDVEEIIGNVSICAIDEKYKKGHVTIPQEYLGEYFDDSNKHGKAIEIKAIALPLQSALTSIDSYDDINEAGTFGETSEVTRAYYSYAKPETTFYTTARKRDTKDGSGYSTFPVDEYPYFTDIPSSLASVYDITSNPAEFWGGYRPNADEPSKMRLLTYGGYERWVKNPTQFDENETVGVMSHQFVENDYWSVTGNDQTPYRGMRGIIGGDTYTVANLEPLNEYADNNDESTGERSGYDADNKSIAHTGKEYNNGIGLRTFGGQFNYNILTGKNFKRERNWQMPCFGDYLAYEPEAAGKLTVYVKQEGVLEQDGNYNLDDQLLRFRPVFILDEQGNTPANIVAETTSRVAGDWMTMRHTANNGSKHLTGGEGSATSNLKLMCDQWIKDNTADIEKTPTIEYGDRAYKPQGVIAMYGTVGSSTPGCTYSSTMEEYRSNLLGARTAGPANGFMILTAGYVKYEFDVKPGKTYYVFAQNGNLGFCSYAFDASTVDADKNQGEYSLDPTKYADSENVEASNKINLSDKLNSVRNVTIANRAFAKDTWTSLVLPFSVGKQQLRKVFGDGVEVIHYTNMTTDHLYLFKHINQMIVAGVPVFIKPSKNVAANNARFENVYIETDEVESINVGGYTCHGSYGRSAITKDSWFLTTQGKFSYLTAQSANIAGTRAWIAPNPGTAPVRGISVGFWRSIEDTAIGEATGIIEVAQPGSALESETDNNVYDAAGRLVRQGTTDLHNLPAGIYIVNGEKKVVK